MRKLLTLIAVVLLLQIALSPLASASQPYSRGPVPPLKRAWMAKSDDPEGSYTTWPVASAGNVYAVSGRGALSVNQTGAREWWRDLSGTTQAFPAIDTSGVYVVGSNKRLLKLDHHTGDQLWEAGLTESSDSSPLARDGRVYLGVFRAKSVVALDASTGAMLWSVQLDPGPRSTPAVSPTTVVIVTEDRNGPEASIVGLTAERGDKKWEVAQREGASSPVLLDESVVLGGGDFYAYRLDIETGRQIWRSPMQGKFGLRNMPAVAEGDVFLADRIGNIYRLDGKTGKRKWIFSDTEGTMDQSFPVVAGKTLYIGTNAGWLYGVNIDTGKLVWKDRVKGIVLSGAADEERFYFGVKFGDEGLYAYEHDPAGKLLTGRPSVFRSLIGGFALFVLLFAGVAFFVRRSRARSN